MRKCCVVAVLALFVSCNSPMGMPPLSAATQTISDPWVDGETPTASKWNSHENTFLSGINNVETAQLVDGTIVNADINASAAIAASKLDLTPIAQATTWDDGTTDAPTLTLQDATNETVTLIKKDAGYLEVTTVAGDGVNIKVGNLKVGDGTPGTTLDGEDAYIEGTLEVDGNTNLAGTATVNNLTVNGTLSAGLTGVRLPSGAVFFMITGACPADTTDITSTYSNKFIRANATGGSTGGSDTHDHGAATGSTTLSAAQSGLPSHTHTSPLTSSNNGGSTGVPQGSNTTSNHTSAASNATGGSAASSGHTHTVSSENNIPAFVTAVLCQVD